VVDFDTEGAINAVLTRFPFGDGITEAVCRIVMPVICEASVPSCRP